MVGGARPSFPGGEGARLGDRIGDVIGDVIVGRGWYTGRVMFVFSFYRLVVRLRRLFAVLAVSAFALALLNGFSFAQPAGDAVAQEGGSEGDVVPIGSVQGDGRNSPYLNQRVRFRGVVTGHYEDRNAAGVVYYTLFVQDEADEADGDPATSDGIAVFLGRQRPEVRPGDEVAVSGRVTEFYGLSEIEDDGLEVQLLSRDNALPPPVALAGVPADPEAYEALEGMRVSLEEARVVAPTYSGCGFFVVGPAVEGRPVRQRADDLLHEIVPVLHRSDVDCGGFPQVKVGDTVSGLVGPLIYHFDQFKIVQQEPDALAVASAPLERSPAPPTAEAGQFTVASFNVENYFDTVSDTGRDAEPVPTAEEVAVKQVKLVAAIGEHLRCPTLLGVQEVENEPLLGELATQLEGVCGFTYTVSHRESVDARGIDVALLSDPARAVVDDVALRQGCGNLDTDVADPGDLCPMGQDPLFSRPPLQVDVRVDGTPYTLFVNHFKSKSGGESITEPRRLAQAAHQRRLVEEVLEADPDARLMVLGDLNDYALSPALLTLTEDGGLVNALMELPPEERYTYTFSGAAQLLDYLLFSPAAAEAVVWADVVHMNADYPFGWAGDPAVAFRVSDHDVPMALLALPGAGEEVAPSAEAREPTAQPVAPADTPAADSGRAGPSAEGVGTGTAWQLIVVGAAVVLVLLIALWARGRG